MVMCVAQKIGPIKASLIHWNGTTGEDLRRARGDRPSIGWHDPWRAELCDQCSHGLPEVRPSTGYNKTFGANDRNLYRSLRELAVDFASSRLKRLQLVLTG